MMSENNLPSELRFENTIYDLRRHLQLYQIGDDVQFLGGVRDCAYGGCPGVAILFDQADTEIDKDWQYYIIAINFGMPLNNISNLLETDAALLNKTGTGNPDRKNWILNENLDGAKECRLDKLRSFCLNTHAGYDDGTYAYLKTMDGNNPPPMAINPSTGQPYLRPQSISEIDPSHYLMLPSNPLYRHLFLDCNNVKWKPDTSTLDYGAFDHGLVRDWIGDGRPHSFFPFVSRFGDVKVLLSKINKLPLGSAFPSPFRTG